MASQQIPQMQTEDRETNQLQNNILQVINPMLKRNPMLFGSLIQNVVLKVGANTINTGLTQPLQGWVITRKKAFADIYDSQDSNNIIGTLILNSNAAVTIDLIAF